VPQDSKRRAYENARLSSGFLQSAAIDCVRALKPLAAKGDEFGVGRCFEARRNSAADDSQSSIHAAVKILPRLVISAITATSACEIAVATNTMAIPRARNRAITLPMTATASTPANIQLAGFASLPMMPAARFDQTRENPVATATATPAR